MVRAMLKTMVCVAALAATMPVLAQDTREIERRVGKLAHHVHVGLRIDGVRQRFPQYRLVFDDYDSHRSPPSFLGTLTRSVNGGPT